VRNKPTEFNSNVSGPHASYVSCARLRDGFKNAERLRITSPPRILPSRRQSSSSKEIDEARFVGWICGSHSMDALTPAITAVAGVGTPRAALAASSAAAAQTCRPFRVYASSVPECRNRTRRAAARKTEHILCRKIATNRPWRIHARATSLLFRICEHRHAAFDYCAWESRPDSRFRGARDRQAIVAGVCVRAAANLTTDLFVCRSPVLHSAIASLRQSVQRWGSWFLDVDKENC